MYGDACAEDGTPMATFILDLIVPRAGDAAARLPPR
jgi:hypothetical protein